jgi:Kdo2-lipid IVA lauroyltransferase/acyltransferase
MYYLVYGLLYLLSLLPLQVLYVLSDFFYVLVYHVAGYRRDVVMKNLSIAFPDRTGKERVLIARRFYRQFTDFFVETIKLFSASDAYIDRHFQADYSAFHREYAKRKKVQVHLGHNFNWELGYMGVLLNIPQKPLGVYMPLDNAVFDRIFRKLRSGKGGYLLPATKMREAMMPFRDDPYCLLLVADQSPPGPGAGIWVNFFGQPTPFVRGPEKGAVASNLSVIFCHVERVKRGYYKGYFELEEENPAALPTGELTRRYARFLEDKMRRQPENWLWTHRRWKWEWKPEYGQIIDKRGS